MIGSGFGGLAAAVRLGARGYRVTIVEKLDAPGGRAYVYRQDGFTFDAGPTIVTAPFLFEELWALCGRRMRDDVELRSVDPFYQIRFEHGDVFTMSGDETAMRAEVARFNPADVSGFERFMRRSEAIYRVGFEQLGDEPFNSIADMARIAGDLVRARGPSKRLQSRLKIFPRRAAQDRLQLPSPSDRRRSVSRERDLLPDPVPGKALGRAFRDGWHRKAGHGLADLIASQGGEIRCGEEVKSILVEDGVATGVVLASRRNSSGKHRGLERRLQPGPIGISSRLRTEGGGPTARSTRLAIRWVSSSGISVSTAGTKTSPITRSCWARAIARSLATSSTASASRAISASTCIGRLRPTLRSRPRAATHSTCSRRPRTCRADRTGGSRPNPIARRSHRRSKRRFFRASRAIWSHRRITTPLDFQTRLNAYHGSGFGLEPTLTQSAWFRPHNASEEVRNLFWSAPARIPAPDCPACFRRPVFSTRLLRMPLFSSDLASLSDHRECRRAIREGSRSFYAASSLLSAETRQRAFGLYAFCRLSDDAIDLSGGSKEALDRLRDRLASAALWTPGALRG